jgi:hypothetical protein
VGDEAGWMKSAKNAVEKVLFLCLSHNGDLCPVIADMKKKSFRGKMVLSHA